MSMYNEASTDNTEAMCTVTMDGKEHSSNDFVAVLSKDNGDAAFFYNTDALTLGMTMKMVAKAFVDSMHQLPEEERESVSAILGDNFEVDTEERTDG